MGAQIFPNLFYVGLLLAGLLTPYIAHLINPSVSDRWLRWALIALALALMIARQGALLPFSVILLVPLIRSGLPALLGGIVALLLFAPVIWWTPAVQIQPLAIGLFFLLGLLSACLPQLARRRPRKTSGDSLLVTVAVCLIIGIAVGLLTAPFGAAEPIYLAWHHWGAYLAPAEAWLAGGLPYRDFPVQYGIGPTTLLAISCGNDCWRGIYFTAVVANALYFAVLACCVIVLTAGRQRGLRWLALLALFCASFVWTAFPSNLGSTAMTPSVAGLRFLPIAALLLHILVAEEQATPRDWIGHVIWLCDLFWSPEGAFFGTLIWWPYLALRDADGGVTPARAFIAMVRGAARGIAALTAGVAGLAFLLWLLSARTVTLSDFLAYILHPPGPLPVNPVGTVWLAIAAILLAIHALGAAGQSVRTRSLYACLLGFLGALSYYLSRSHDNNILNLFPLIVVLLLAATREDEPTIIPAKSFDTAFAQTILAAMVAFIATVNVAPWIDGAAREGLFHFGPSRLIARFSPQPRDVPAMLSRDALAGLGYLRAHNAGAVVLIDDRKLIPWHTPGKSWTGVTNVANFEPLPPAMVAHYICRGAAVYGRPGWLLVDERNYGAWLAMFRAAYDVGDQRHFGHYGAYYLLPRKTGSPCDHG